MAKISADEYFLCVGYVFSHHSSLSATAKLHVYSYTLQDENMLDI